MCEGCGSYTNNWIYEYQTYCVGGDQFNLNWLGYIIIGIIICYMIIKIIIKYTKVKKKNDYSR